LSDKGKTMNENSTIDGIDYGPLALLIGTWKGEKGVDKAPDTDGEERSLFYETILYEPIGAVTNAKKQILAILRYHQVTQRKTNDEVYHNETGYWTWDSQTDEITHSLTIPRGLALLAGGGCAINEKGEHVFSVSAKDGDPHWGIVQTPFMAENARTTAFTQQVFVDGDSMRYEEITSLFIYGRSYDHKDINRLTRV